MRRNGRRASDVFITIQTVNASCAKNNDDTTTHSPAWQFSHYGIITDVQGSSPGKRIHGYGLNLFLDRQSWCTTIFRPAKISEDLEFFTLLMRVDIKYWYYRTVANIDPLH